MRGLVRVKSGGGDNGLLLGDSEDFREGLAAEEVTVEAVARAEAGPATSGLVGRKYGGSRRLGDTDNFLLLGDTGLAAEAVTVEAVAAEAVAMAEAEEEADKELAVEAPAVDAVVAAVGPGFREREEVEAPYRGAVLVLLA